ncbi:MAG TPA: tryptophan synthase subunit alpha [Alphaproteobacteria bacterium]|nr:tryptophan synthase subunit alpha [Rhodospirillaceae bacterium]HRJ12064.1 tryptophan synthase subunit alpha [Alphaproteobacteria bacterium]
MSKIKNIIGARKAFIPYITAADPDLATTLAAMKMLADAGADIIELGIPFTDPIADGPTIQKATERALKNDFRMPDMFDVVRQFRASHATPVLLMTYANPVFSMGYDKFCAGAAAAGVNAVLITDLPPEEACAFRGAAHENNLGTVFLCSPTTTPERLKLIDQAATEFVYYIAHAGVTGVRTDLPTDVAEKLQKLKSQLQNKLCVGFGVSTPEQARALSAHADGVIVGSAVVKLFEKYQCDELLVQLKSFTQKMAEAVHA